MRQEAEIIAGGAVLTLMEKRTCLACVVRAALALIPPDSDLWQSIKKTDEGTDYRLPDELKSIVSDNDLAHEGSEARGQVALSQLLERIIYLMLPTYLYVG